MFGWLRGRRRSPLDGVEEQVINGVPYLTTHRRLTREEADAIKAEWEAQYKGRPLPIIEAEPVPYDPPLLEAAAVDAPWPLDEALLAIRDSQRRQVEAWEAYEADPEQKYHVEGPPWRAVPMPKPDAAPSE